MLGFRFIAINETEENILYIFRFNLTIIHHIDRQILKLYGPYKRGPVCCFCPRGKKPIINLIYTVKIIYDLPEIH